MFFDKIKTKVNRKRNRVKKTFKLASKISFILWAISVLSFFIMISLDYSPKSVISKLISSATVIGGLTFIFGFTFWFLSKAKTKLEEDDKKISKKGTRKTNKTIENNVPKKFLTILLVLITLFSAVLYIRAEKIEKNLKNKDFVITPTSTLIPSQAPTPTAKPSVVPSKRNSIVETQPVLKKLPVLSGGNIFNLVNSYRLSNGRPSLSISDELCRLAESRADYMMANNMAAAKSNRAGEHSGFNDDFINQYSGNGLGENLAFNSAMDVSVIELWKNSPPHRDLMLWTEKDGIPITKGCIATRVSEVGSVVVLLVGDK